MRCVYRIIETTTGKFYIGSTANTQTRWAWHRTTLHRGTHHSKHLQRAWNKYGADAFRFESVEDCTNCDDAQLLAREQAWLDKTECWRRAFGFNISKSADAPWRGRKHSTETRAKMSKTRQGRVVSEETKRKIAQSLSGRKRPTEVVEKMRASLQGRKLTEEHKANIGRSGLGRVVTEATRNKIAAARRGQKAVNA